MDNDELSQERTYLDTSDGMGEYAKGYGALYDKRRGQWYVVGEVPLDLLNLIPKVPRSKAPPVVAPSCPICGFHTKLIEAKNGPFYGCSQHAISGCRGSIDHDRYLETIGQPRPKSVGNILNPGASEKSGRAVPPAKTSTIKMNPKLRSAIKEIEKRCVAEFSSKAELDRWLSVPKRALDGKTPLECMSTLEGCKKVIHLIKTRWD
jgi:hypothetical protein